MKQLCIIGLCILLVVVAGSPLNAQEGEPQPEETRTGDEVKDDEQEIIDNIEMLKNLDLFMDQDIDMLDNLELFLANS